MMTATKATKQLAKFQRLVAEQSDNTLKGLIACGNIKIPVTTGIFNMSSAHDCMSLKLGLCAAVKAGVKCYALKSENTYRPQCQPYRDRQKEYWLSTSASKFAMEFITLNASKRNPFTALRFNEAGDFHSQDCIAKADAIARILSDFGIVCYCYTSRYDLDYTGVKSLIVNGSGFTKAGVTSEFQILKKGQNKPKGYGLCPMDCKKCTRCQKRGMKTCVPEH